MLCRNLLTEEILYFMMTNHICAPLKTCNGTFKSKKLWPRGNFNHISIGTVSIGFFTSVFQNLTSIFKVDNQIKTMHKRCNVSQRSSNICIVRKSMHQNELCKGNVIDM